MFYALVSIQAPFGAEEIQSPRMDSGLLRGAKSAARNDGVYMISNFKSLY
jgi:hypothetical protein